MEEKTSGKAATKRPAKAQPKPYHHGNLRESLLAAADTVLAEQGVHGTTLRDEALATGLVSAEDYDRIVRPEDMTRPG